jgi:hypothetical protein
MFRLIQTIALILIASTAHAATITNVRVIDEGIFLSIDNPTGDSLVLYEAPLYGDPAVPTVLATFESTTDVLFERFEKDRDRLYAGFAVTPPDAPPPKTFRYVTDLSALHPTTSFTFPSPASIKGLQVNMVDDAIALGVKHAALNVIIPSVLDRGDAPGETWDVDGRAIGINAAYIRDLDRRVKELTDAGMTVTFIFLNPVPASPVPNNPLIHPLTDLAQAPHHLGAFNLTTREGFLHYRAAVEYLAHRYTSPDGQYGWVQRYIVGNEVNSHWQWHNLGEITPEVFMKDYERSVRVADLAVRRHHPDARAFVSLEHHWTIRYESETRSTTGATILDHMDRYADAGGDYPWCVAQHPYPENLFEPRFWNDETATLSFDTPRITFKNIEVLPAYLAQNRYLFQGKPREIILSEQGFHTPDGDDGEAVQAAAYAYAYRKVAALHPAITSFILHRHVDHGREGGLNLGLWARDLEAAHPNVPKTKKKCWYVFRDADTTKWEEAFAFALPIIGIESWDAAKPQTVTHKKAPGTMVFGE